MRQSVNYMHVGLNSNTFALCRMVVMVVIRWASRGERG